MPQEYKPGEEVPVSMTHPARYSKPIMQRFVAIVDEFVVSHPAFDPIEVLDPFAGTGRIHSLVDQSPLWGIETYGVEIEPEWANMHPRTTCASALDLPFPTQKFHMVITSPTYGNRLADKHDAKDGSLRRSYTHDLRRLTGDQARTLHPDNTGALHFGEEYKKKHIRAWQEVWRVLRPTGWFVLNVSDFVKNKNVVPVARWHLDTCMEMGFNFVDDIEVSTRRLKFGSNADARVATERIFVFEKPGRR